MKTTAIKTNKVMIKKILDNYKITNKYLSKNKLKKILKNLNGNVLSDSMLEDIDELYSIFFVIDILFNYKILNCKTDDYIYLNYDYNGNMEFDVLNIISKENNKIVLDIEVKRDSNNKGSQKLLEKLNQQSLNNVNDNLERLFDPKEYTFISLKFLNQNFKGGYFRDIYKEIKFEYTTLEEVSEHIGDYSIDSNNSTIITDTWKQSYWREAIHSIKDGTYQFSKDNDLYYEKINDFLKSNDNVLFVNGPAGSGKTILALRTFYQIPNSNMLLLNEKFYKTYFNMSQDSYPPKLITFGTDWFIDKKVANMNIAIIDESQRISYRALKLIIDLFDKVILFGDSKQIFARTDQEYYKFYDNLVNDFGTDLILSKPINLKTTPRFPEGVGEILDFLVFSGNKDLNKKNEKKELINYEINLFFTPSRFLEYFKELKKKNERTKIYTNYDSKNSDDIPIKIGDEWFICRGHETTDYSYEDYNDFSEERDLNFIGNTYHALSYDVDNAFVYIPNLRLTKKGYKKYLVFSTDEWRNNDQFELDKQRNELNILFTRAIKSLNILIDDLDVFIYLSEKSSDIISNWKPNSRD